MDDSLFRALCAALPGDTEYERPETSAARNEPRAERAILPLSIRADREPRVALAPALRIVCHALRSPDIAGALLGRFEEVSRLEPSAAGLRSQVFLSRDFPPYAIGPHTDVPRRVLSMILYLSPANAPDNWGTTLFRPAEARFECQQGLHYPFEGFVADRLVSFRPNRAVIFLRTHRSFHGLLPIEPSTGPRDTLLYELMR